MTNKHKPPVDHKVLDIQPPPEPANGEQRDYYNFRLAKYMYQLAQQMYQSAQSAPLPIRTDTDAPMLLSDISYEGEGWAVLQCGDVTVRLGYTLLHVINGWLAMGVQQTAALVNVSDVLGAFNAITNEAMEGKEPRYSDQ